jgi:hypothetical protein
MDRSIKNFAGVFSVPIRLNVAGVVALAGACDVTKME